MRKMEGKPALKSVKDVQEGDRVYVLTQRGKVSTYFCEIATPKIVIHVYPDSYIDVKCNTDGMTQTVHLNDVAFEK